MTPFVIEMHKTIVVSIEAESEDEAIEIALNNDDGFDGAWDRAEPDAVVIDEVTE